MRRRDFIRFAGGAAAWPVVADAQPAKQRRIGVLMAYAERDPEGQVFVAAFREGLRALGWSEDSTLRIADRWAGADPAIMQRLAKDLVALQPDLILSHSTTTTATLLRETRSIPIVFANVTDPIGSGFVTNLPRPGGNATGFINMEDSMSGKWLELLKELSPNVRRAAFLFNPVTAPYSDYYLKTFKAAAPSLSIEGSVAPVRNNAELEMAFASQAREPNGGLLIMTDNFTTAHRAEIVALAAHYKIPAVYPYRFFADLGGLVSYGSDPRDNFRRAAAYADRILRGTSPSDLPVEAPVKFDLVINAKTAKSLGLTVPLYLQQRADEVIE
jgi:putative tryptophan/tyrosine transport system substrate-binding protein